MNTSNSPAGLDIEAWYAQYAGRLRRVARRIVGNEFDAEDATHDAFLAAFRAHGRFRDASDPFPWLSRIATRKALNIAAVSRTSAVVLDTVTADAALPSAEDEALAKAETQRVTALVADEVPVALHLLHGLRFRDVGERLGIPPATAATRIRRGKRRLRALLAATTAHDERSKTA